MNFSGRVNNFTIETQNLHTTHVTSVTHFGSAVSESCPERNDDACVNNNSMQGSNLPSSTTSELGTTVPPAHSIISEKNAADHTTTSHGISVPSHTSVSVNTAPRDELKEHAQRVFGTFKKCSENIAIFVAFVHSQATFLNTWQNEKFWTKDAKNFQTIKCTFLNEKDFAIKEITSNPKFRCQIISGNQLKLVQNKKLREAAIKRHTALLAYIAQIMPGHTIEDARKVYFLFCTST